MSAPKLAMITGVLLKAESTYLAGGTAPAAATDGVLIRDEATAEISFLNDGDRGKWPGTGGSKLNGPQTGAQVAVPFVVEGRGAGAAYSASIKPPDLFVLMQMSGHAWTLDTTAGAQKYTAKPISSSSGSAYTSAYGEFYEGAQKWPVVGGYADVSVKFDANDFLLFSFATQGVLGAAGVTDGTCPVITTAVTFPPKVVNTQLAIGAWTTPIMKSGEFKAGREISARADGGGSSSNGHAGYSMGGRAGTLTLTVEQVALSTFNPYTARAAGTSYLVQLTVGSTQFNRVVLKWAQAQITDVKEGKDGSTKTWELTLKCATSGPYVDDDYEFAWT
jgi:hypothetical protein